MPDHLDHYDLVVIGSGPAGEKGAAQAAYFGKRVALIERQDLLGGACANTGTLPSKTLRESALGLSGLRQREIFGIKYAVHTAGLSVADFMVQKDVVCKREVERIHRNLDRHDIDVIRGHARLLDAKTIRVERSGESFRELTADVVLVASGSSPRRPPEIPFDDPDVDDSDEVLSLDRIPESFIVVGGGVIGCEYASIFGALGTTKVTLIEARDRLLGFLDDEICDRLTLGFTRLGMDLVFNDTVSKYEKRAGGRGVRVTLKSGRVIEADRLLAAAGRVGNTQSIGLKEVGVKMDARDLILVDEHFQTNVPGIYAAGDVIGFPSLASTSMEQGRVAMCHALSSFSDKTPQEMSTPVPYGLCYRSPRCRWSLRTEVRRQARPGRREVRPLLLASDNARGQIINLSGRHDQDRSLRRRRSACSASTSSASARQSWSTSPRRSSPTGER